jgi:hypothetical protein
LLQGFSFAYSTLRNQIARCGADYEYYIGSERVGMELILDQVSIPSAIKTLNTHQFQFSLLVLKHTKCLSLSANKNHFC